MYIQPPLAEKNPATLHEFIRTYPFGTLVLASSNAFEANHMPFELVEQDGDVVLRAHMPKGNPVWRQVEANTEALAIFQGPHGYMSPSWHPARKTHGKLAPGWNYAAVHAAGPITVQSSREWLLEHLQRLTETQERTLKEPWDMHEPPKAFVEASVNHIMGVEIAVESLQGKFLASQQYKEADRHTIVQAMVNELGPMRQPLAEMMLSRKSARP